MMTLAEALRRINKPNDELTRMQKFISGNYPATLKALRMIDTENMKPKRGKGFTLVKRESKKHGFLYYVRYYHDGKMIPSKWNTRTNNQEEAERFAVENRERLIGRYQKTRDTQIYEFLADFYADPKGMAQRRIRLAADSVRLYHNSVVKRFIPFLKKNRITDFGQITPVTLDNFQDYLLSLGVRPQSANNYMKPIRQIFAYLARKGIIKENPVHRIRRVPVEQSDLIPRGCYELEKISGVFGKRWKDETSYLLTLLIYTTGMRNCEIQSFRAENIVTIDGCRFIDIRESKTSSGIRLVPLHDFVYGKIKGTADKSNGSPLFGVSAAVFGIANMNLAERLGVSEEEMKREKISFYSGRHFWKTLMSSEGLGEDVEEVFMGHKVSGNVAKLYNHRDKHGKERMVKKAREVFAILDRCIFNAKPSET